MTILAKVKEVLRAQPLTTAAFFLVALILIGIAITIPIVRHVEIDHLQRAAERSSQILVEALHNPSILTGEPDTATADLNNSATELSRIHDEVVLYPVYFAQNAARSALAYTEYTARIGKKLTQVSQSALHAQTTFETYSRDVEILKASNLAGRAAAQDDVNAIAADARSSTELAYQECALLVTLTQEYGIIRSRALHGLDSVGSDVEPAIQALAPALHAALINAHLRRKVFNPAARAPI